MLDIELFRKKLDTIIESEKNRFKDPSIAERVLEYDIKWRTALQDIEELRKQRNEISVKIGELKKIKDDKKAEEAIKNSKEIKEKIDELEKQRVDFLEQREEYRYMVGNILYESVPIGETEEENKIERIVGDLPKFSFKPLSHVELVSEIGGADLKKASEIAGSRFYYLKGELYG